MFDLIFFGIIICISVLGVAIYDRISPSTIIVYCIWVIFCDLVALIFFYSRILAR